MKGRGRGQKFLPATESHQSHYSETGSISEHTSPCASMNRLVFNPHSHIPQRTAALSGKRAEGNGGLSSSRLLGGEGRNNLPF